MNPPPPIPELNMLVDPIHNAVAIPASVAVPPSLKTTRRKRKRKG